MTRGLRLMIYDATCTGGRLAPGLTHAWWVGSHLYRALGRIDASFGARRWDEALAWMATHEPHRAIDEVQLWMHGKWGGAFLERDRLDEGALLRGSPHRAAIDALASRLHECSLFWFRTCETFGAHAGQRFAASCAERLGCRVAGHTHVIGDWQSGLHSLRPGEAPDWSPEEGLLEGTAATPQRARWSTPLRPRTIHCLQGRVPQGW